MAPEDHDRLLRATATNHRARWRIASHGAGGRIDRVGGAALHVSAGGAGEALTFPLRRGDPEAVLTWARTRRVTGLGWWALRSDGRLGAALVGRGFGWGWSPHWMAIDLTSAVPEPPEYRVEPTSGDGVPAEVPYGRGSETPAGVLHLAVRERSGGTVVGHVEVFPWRGVAGIYSMGVAESHRRRGIGRALTLAACRAAAAAGCTHASLNATQLGTALYHAAGFESLGWGQTWWWFPSAAPTARQTRLADAVGGGDLATLTALAPVPDELTTPLPGGTSLAQLAAQVERPEVVQWFGERLDVRR